MKVSVIIPSHRSEGRVLHAVHSCARQSLSDFEIIVALNTPDDSSRNALERLALENLKIVVADAIGVNRARNAGARAAASDLFFFMDDDCRMTDPDFLKKLIHVFETNPGFAIVGGAYEDPADAPRVLRSYHALTRLWIEAGYLSDPKQTPTSCKNLLGGNLAVTRAAFGTGLNEAIVSGGDETEFLRRAEREGKRIGFHPGLLLEHHGSRSWRHACTRAWKQNHARGLHGLGSKQGSAGRVFAHRANHKLLIRAWPYLVLHVGIGNLAAAAGSARRALTS
jgi:glycosyltransferase involved in cell wall biosynthesis